MKKGLAFAISIAFTALPALVYSNGDVDAGRSKSESCAGCHGADGNSMLGSFPKLAGQHSSYIKKQLIAFKENTRNAPMMAPLALGLNDQDIDDIAAYYSEQKVSENAMPVLPIDDDDDEDEDQEMVEQKAEELKSLMVLGSDLYRNGDLTQEVSACIACHGPYGEGNEPAAFPALKGQHADYLIKTLKDYKKGERTQQSDNMMYMIAKKMTDKQIEAVSYHISMMK